MCLQTEQTKPFIAEKDIIVYKRCWVRPVSKFKIALFGFWQDHYQYSKSEIVTVLTPYHDNGPYSLLVSIYEGLHANVDNIKNCNTAWVIPKGAEYYLSIYENEVVSNKMVFKKMIGKEYWFKKIIWK
jgi:hypothetical protein